MSSFRGLLGSFVLGMFSSAVWATPILVEDFTTNPIAAGRASVVGVDRYTWNSGSGTMSAAYNSQLATSKLVWPLGMTLTEGDSFDFDVRFRIQSLIPQDNQAAQIAFGLLNSSTTGNDRPGGTADWSWGGTGRPISDTVAWDTVTMDYYPNVSNSGSPGYFGYDYKQTLQSTIITSDNGTTNYFTQGLNGGAANYGEETSLGESGEAALGIGTDYHVQLAYDAGTRIMKLSLFDGADSPVNTINIAGRGGAGGPDGVQNTIQFTFPAGQVFAVDSFGLLLWQDTFNLASSSVAGNVVFDSFSVNAVPEPSTLLGLGLLAPWLLRRRKAKTA